MTTPAMLTIHIGRLRPRPPLILERDAIVNVLAHDRAQMRAHQLKVGDVCVGYGVVTAIITRESAAA